MIPELKVVVIDDSPFARQTLVELLESERGVRVIGRASDGDEGLRLVLEKQPDLVTLDLEMPRLDGIAFLRLLMARRPTPVLVVTSLGPPGGAVDEGRVFKALELGALDFVAKPSARATPELREIRDDLLAKVRMVRVVHADSLAERARSGRSAPSLPRILLGGRPHATGAGTPPERLIAIGASTGGPPALQQILAALAPVEGGRVDRLLASVLIAQHMPAAFTRAFAERLARTSGLTVREATDGEPVLAGEVLVAPGGCAMEVRRSATDAASLYVAIESGASLHEALAASEPAASPSPQPSIDRLFESAAKAMGRAVLGVVLTGMTGDGARGVRAIKERLGRVIAESDETAVIAGMPQQAIATGAVDEVLPLPAIALAIARYARNPLAPPS